MSKASFSRIIEIIIGFVAIFFALVYVLIAIPELVTGYNRINNLFGIVAFTVLFSFNLACLISSGIVVVWEKYKKPSFWFNLNCLALVLLLVYSLIDMAGQSESFLSLIVNYLYGLLFYLPIILLFLFFCVYFRKRYTTNSSGKLIT